MSLPGLFFGGNKGSDKFQPLNLGFSHEKRSIFDSGALVRARVRFRKESGHAVAWLDDLHSLHSNLGGKGDRLSSWMLQGSAPYATSTSNHGYIGGVKIWRMGDTFIIEFYGPRYMIDDPQVFSVYAEVPFASATRWDANTWKIRGDKRYHAAFKGLVKGAFPMIFDMLLKQPKKLVAQDGEGQRVHAQWAAAPSYPIMVYSK